MRYAGQGFEFPVLLPKEIAKNPTQDKIRGLFEQNYKMLFGRQIDGIDIEITVWAVNVEAVSDDVPAIAVTEPAAEKVTREYRDLFDPTLNRTINAAVIDRHQMVPGDYVKGPAIIVEKETTTILPPNRIATMQNDSSINITIAAQATKKNSVPHHE